MLMQHQCLDGRYRLVNPLSNGGFGETWIAEDTKRPGNPQCVVKHLILHDKHESVIQRVRLFFQDEAIILEKLGQHDQIPRLLAYFEEQEEFYLVQELIHGHSLAQEIKPGQTLSESEVVSLLTEVLQVLEFVHRQGVIHRDIKPANLMRRDSDRKIMLIDFGAVKQVLTSFEQHHSTVVIGTVDYMPIEQLQGHPQFNSDIYALGLVAIQALTGLESPQLRDPAQRRNLPKSKLTAILDRMIHPDYQQRYSSARDVLAALSSNQDIPATQLTPSTPVLPATEIDSVAKPVAKPWRRWLPVLAAVGLVGGLFGGNQWRVARARELFHQGTVQSAAKDYRGAIDRFNQSLFFDSQDPLTYLDRGRAYLSLNDWQAAASNFDQAIQHWDKKPTIGGVGLALDTDPQTHTPIVVDTIPGLAAAQAGVKKGDRILEIDGQPTANLSSEYIHRLLIGQPEQPITLKLAPDRTVTAKRSLVPNQDLVQAHIGRSSARGSLGDYKGAIEDANQGLELDPKNVDLYFTRGQALSRSGDKQAAIQDFSQLIKANPTTDGYFFRGKAYLDLQQYEAAIADFTQALQRDPKNTKAYLGRATAYGATNNHQAALNDSDRLIALDPKIVSGYLIRSTSLTRLGENQAALDTLNQAIAVNPNEAELYQDRAFLRDKLNDSAGAVEDYTQAIRFDPKFAVAYHDRGGLRKKNRDFQGAIEDFNKAIELKSDFGAAYFQRGLVYTILKNRNAAISDFQQAAKLFVDQKDTASYNRALAYLKLLQS